ncbi:hypothetical protein DL546_009184 [Coniochaeta pulveracea]|uniref:Protein kinase domain-containing protein n=1 Tax=Coniochaeta pulveracea TaxID=177199 RepID=A0A420YGA0_9PEZI|nr:hypothetical protein DL546_009184 [Coniochaeta pulveracea]
MNFITLPKCKLALSRGLEKGNTEFTLKDWVTTVYDADSRRWLSINCREGKELLMDTGEDEEPFEKAFPICAVIREEIDAGPPDLNALVFNVDGKVLCRSTDPYDDVTPGTHYAPLSDYHIPAHTKVLGRDELIELERLIAFVDIVTPVASSSPAQERLVFKYYQYVYGIAGNWNSIHIGAKLSDHPHIAPVRHVIVDETDRSRVVGFTMPYYPVDDLRTQSSSRASRPFHLKLKWIQQLMRTVDDLHLKYGVVHGDLHEGNMMIDPATDNLVLIDFGCAQKIGTPQNHYHHRAALTHEPPRAPLLDIGEDIKHVLHAVYRLVTGIIGGRSDGNGGFIVTTSAHIREGEWVKAPNVTLDHPIEEYQSLCVNWLRARNAGPRITKHCQASEPLDYPDYMPPPEVDIKAYKRELADPNLRPRYQPPCEPEWEGLLEDMRGFGWSWEMWSAEWIKELRGLPYATSGRNFLRRKATAAGLSVLGWERPLTAHLDRTRPLLANGKYQDEYVGAGAAPTTQRKRKHSAGQENVVDQDTEQDGDEHGGRTLDSEGVTPTKRVTRSATKKKAGNAGPTPCEPTRKVAAPKRKRKAAPSKAKE